MRTRRDQVQAYRFVTRRIVSGMLSGDPETTNLPMRRLGMAVVGSVIAAAIVLGGAGAYGQFTGNTAPLETNTLVIERETGATYVFADGVLHPTLNYTSARLILNEADAPVRTMSRASIAERPRGRTVGIVGAPDALPDPKSLVGLPWSVCDVPDPGDSRRSTTRLVIDRPLAGGTPLGGEAVLVRGGGQRFLLANGARAQIVGGDPALAALKMTNATTLDVGAPLLNAVPAGPALRRLGVEGDGAPSGRTVGGRQARVGDVFRAAGEHYVLTRDGLVSIGEVSALLLQSDGGQVTDITPDEAGRLLTDERLEAEGTLRTLPALRPVRPGQSVVCATYRPGPGGGPPTTTLEVFDRAPAELTGDGATAARQGPRDAVETADEVLLPGGRGALVQAAPGAGEGTEPAAGATVYLITPQGMRYPLGKRSGDAVAALGYGGVKPLVVPASLLSLVPTGPTLERQDALAYFAPDDEAGSPSPAAPGEASASPGEASASPAQGG
ncbi:type VII secretion protein EccB [Micromonospora coxensis]|uniref:type VII secretion protein EccB n=1 Tax=Micromonospora coxensis TaxID=356852 RepID=UPI003434D80D